MQKNNSHFLLSEKIRKMKLNYDPKDFEFVSLNEQNDLNKLTEKLEKIDSEEMDKLLVNLSVLKRKYKI